MIKITPENRHLYDPEEKGLFWSDSREFKEAMSVNMSLNDYLDGVLGDLVDWGGKYASWLESFGIETNSENGWWSKGAVLPVNLWLFILDYSLEGGYEPLEKLREKIPKAGGISISSRWNSVLDLIKHNDIDIPDV